MSVQAYNYLNNAILKMIRKYNIQEKDATRILKESFLYDSLLLCPEQTIHDDIDTMVDIVYSDYVASMA